MTQAQTTNKPSYFRITLKKQNNRVEYRILASDGNAYYTVQMHNGRAINCFQANGEKCPSRHYHPGSPCKHMQRVNDLERIHREQQKVQSVLQSEKVAGMSDEMKQTVAHELQRYIGVISSQTGMEEPPRTKDEWKEALRRQKKADRAAAKEFRASLKVVKAVQEKEQQRQEVA